MGGLSPHTPCRSTHVPWGRFFTVTVTRVTPRCPGSPCQVPGGLPGGEGPGGCAPVAWAPAGPPSSRAQCTLLPAAAPSPQHVCRPPGFWIRVAQGPAHVCPPASSPSIPASDPDHPLCGGSSGWLLSPVPCASAGLSGPFLALAHSQRHHGHWKGSRLFPRKVLEMQIIQKCSEIPMGLGVIHTPPRGSKCHQS